MDYEKMYKAVLKTATQWIKDGCSDKEKICLESVFPELRESEDERIRKWMVELVESQMPKTFIEVKKQDVFAWLERQKEQKPAQSEEEKEYVRTLKGLVSDFIRDSGGGITDVEYYQNICDWLDGRHIEQKPAEWDDYTKTNLGRAIQIIKDARGTLHGYQTDDGIYECDKAIEALEHFLYRGLEIEKSAEWSEEDEEMLNSCICSIEESKENRYAYKETDGDTSYDHEIAWLKSLPERFNPQPNIEICPHSIKSKSYLETDYPIEQKPAERSLEDDHIIGFVYDLLNEIEWKDDWAMSKDECLQLLSNYIPQKPAEWSEEDEIYLQDALWCVEKAEKSCKDEEDKGSCWSAKRWLKSLRPVSKESLQPHWKPSEHQMSMLLAVVNDPNNAGSESCYISLKSLYNDLKKL